MDVDIKPHEQNTKLSPNVFFFFASLIMHGFNQSKELKKNISSVYTASLENKLHYWLFKTKIELKCFLDWFDQALYTETSKFLDFEIRFPKYWKITTYSWQKLTNIKYCYD